MHVFKKRIMSGNRFIEEGRPSQRCIDNENNDGNFLK